jgi:phosphotriesterase-related protein
MTVDTAVGRGATGPKADVGVQTVTGPIPVADLGMTLMHEHLFGGLAQALHRGVRDFSSALARAAVTAANAWMVREDPYSCADNCVMDDEDITVAELGLYVDAGGRTVVCNSSEPTGRHPAGLLRVAQRTGLNVIMGSGWSLAHGFDDSVGHVDPDTYAEVLLAEFRHGVDVGEGHRVRPGIIGEIGVGPRFTDSERMTLIAACMAQPTCAVPLLIHLPGWQRRAHEVLDIVFSYGVDPAAVVLCHMDPSGKDTAYQREVADRGVWLEFDMIGMQFNYPGEGQSPSVEDTATAIAGLVADGLGAQLLLSQDVGLKAAWTRYGGNGFAYVPVAFIPRLVELGVGGATELLTANPAALFTAASAR